MHKLIFISSLLLAISSCKAQELKERFSKIFQSYIDSGFTGVVLLVKNDTILLNRGYGYSDDQAKTLNNTKTLFNVASIGKQFTAVIVLKLEEKGLLKTSDLISKYTGNLGGLKDSATIHHLLTHTSGLFVEGAALDYSSRDNYIASVRNTALESKPGEKHRYSNAGYTLLAAIVEIVTKETFEDYQYKNLFQPAGMIYTGYPWEKRIQKDLLATGYDNKGVAQPPSNDTWGNKGPGNVVTNTEDMYNWYKAWFDEQIISKGIKEKILKDHIPGKDNYSWSKGVTSKGKKIFHKGGGRADFQSQVMWWPDYNLYLFFSTNRDKDLRRLIFKDINVFMENY